MQAIRRYDAWIANAYGDYAQGLPVFRIVFALSLLFFFLPRYLWISHFPDSFFLPPVSLALFSRGFPPAWFWNLLDFGLVLASCCLLIGYRARAAALAIAGMFVLGDSFEYSFGKIDHNILLPLTPTVLAFSGWDQAYSRSNPGRLSAPIQAWPLALLSVLIGTLMLTAGIAKALTGWLDLHSQATLGHLIQNSYGGERPTFLGHVLIEQAPDWFWEIQDWVTVVLESSLIVAAVSPRAFRTVCAITVFFHAGIFFTMEIFFSPNLMAYLAFAAWNKSDGSPTLGELPDCFGKRLNAVRAWHVGAATGITVLVHAFIGNPWFQVTAGTTVGAGVAGTVGSAVAMLIGGTHLARVAQAAFRRTIQSPAPGGSETHPVVLYDGECGLCDRWVDFVLRRDKARWFRFAALQSRFGQESLQKAGLPGDYRESLVLIHGGRLSTGSTAVILTLRGLGPAWRWAQALMLVPTGLREWAYKLVAINRFRIFGKETVCRIPTREQRELFLDDATPPDASTAELGHPPSTE